MNWRHAGHQLHSELSVYAPWTGSGGGERWPRTLNPATTFSSTRINASSSLPPARSNRRQTSTWTPAHANADNPLAVRVLGAHRLKSMDRHPASTGCLRPPRDSRLPRRTIPLSSTEPRQVGPFSSPQNDNCRPPIDIRQPLARRAFFLRVSMHFCQSLPSMITMMI